MNSRVIYLDVIRQMGCIICTLRLNGEISDSECQAERQRRYRLQHDIWLPNNFLLDSLLILVSTLSNVQIIILYDLYYPRNQGTNCLPTLGAI
jgi:hypothetical protein